MTEIETTDPLWWDAWRGVLFTSNKVIRVVENDLKQHSGLSLAFLDVLSRLYDAPGRRLRMQELSDRALFTFSGVTRLVDRIERDGLVRRERVPGDRRGVYVQLTPEGAETYERAMERHIRDVGRAFAPLLSAEQHQAVSDALWGFWHDDATPEQSERDDGAGVDAAADGPAENVVDRREPPTSAAGGGD